MSDSNWSVPETEVLAAVGDALDADREAVLATVIDVEGSAYRRPGAKMVIEDGESAGSVTAGCLEEEVRTLAADVRAAGEPRVETFDLTGDDGTWGLGMGCNGIITILLEPVDESHRPVVERVGEGGDVGVITVVDGDRPRGERGYYTSNEGFSGALPAWLRTALAEPTAALLDQGDADTLRIDRDEGSVEVFVDGIEAPPHLVVFGSGPDVGPVVDLAKRVDFRVTVVGFRGAQATSETFPAADEVLASSPANVESAVAFDPDTYAVVMTHNFVDDRLVLEALLDTPVPYIGLMGPTERFEELLDAFADEGVTLPEDAFDRIHAPIGLDLGGDSPYRIAYSIVGELLAVANDRTPQHLSEREGPIHDRTMADPETADRTTPE